MKKLSILNIVPFLILIVIVIIFFWKSLFFGYLPIPSDIIVNSYLPWMSYHSSNEEVKNPLLSDPVTQFCPSVMRSTKILREGKVSLWDPFIFCGKPDFIVPLIPPFNILQYLLTTFMSYGLTIIAQVFLSGLFMYLFLRYGLINLGKFASLIGAIVFMLNGVFMVWLEFGGTIGAGLWFPLIFLFIDKTISKKSLFCACLGAILLGIQCFSGNLQLFSYLLLACFFYASFRIICLYKNRIAAKELFKPVILVLLVFIFGILLTCVYLVPVFSRAESGFRQEVKLKELNPLPVANLVTFVIPDFYGTPAPPHSYGVVRNWFYETGLIKKQVVKVGGEN
ncbi:hypothetical protein KKB18_12470, partial [bacterium]|nr:hypothetical protein [bacterium]